MCFASFADSKARSFPFSSPPLVEAGGCRRRISGNDSGCLERALKFDPSRPFDPWFYHIARKKLNDFLRDKYKDLSPGVLQDSYDGVCL